MENKYIISTKNGLIYDSQNNVKIFFVPFEMDFLKTCEVLQEYQGDIKNVSYFVKLSDIEKYEIETHTVMFFKKERDTYQKQLNALKNLNFAQEDTCVTNDNCEKCYGCLKNINIYKPLQKMKEYISFQLETNTNIYNNELNLQERKKKFYKELAKHVRLNLIANNNGPIQSTDVVVLLMNK